MAEERITEVETPSGNTHTHTTVITDGESSRGGGATWLILLVVVIVAAIGIWMVSGMNQSEVAKDNAIAEAANNVGDAAQGAGQAVEETAQNVGNNTN